MSHIQSTEHEQALVQALGAAVIHVWGELPRDIQETLFEHAIVAGHRSARDESLREQLAKYLHDHHERTQAAHPQ